MRLFVYGGTKHDTRRLLQPWPRDFTHLAAQMDSLTADGAWVYGCGFIDAMPVVVVRQLQQPEKRGGYPYTLLMEPDPGHWDVFDHNPARMIAAILADVEMRHLVLETPEDIRLEDFAGRLRALAPAGAGRAPSASSRDMAALWVGAVRESAEESVTLGGAAESPLMDVDALSQVLDAVPPCFRIGCGWIVRGGPEFTAALEIPLIVTASGGLRDDDNDAFSTAGRAILAAWAAIGEYEDRPEDLARRERLPLRAWERETGVASTVFLERLLQLHHLKSGAVPRGTCAIVGPPDDGPLAREIRLATLVALVKTAGELDPKSRELVLQSALDQDDEVEAALIARLDENDVAEALFSRNLRPDRTRLRMSGQQRHAAWRRCLAGAADADVPDVAEEALDDLRANTKGSFAEQWLETARKCTEGRFHVWAGRPRSAEVAAAVRGWLKDDVRTRVMTGTVWDTMGPDYALFADDPGGRWLVAHVKERARPAGNVIVEQLVRDLAAGQLSKPAQDQATSWLEALGNSPLRKLLPLDALRGVAQLDTSSWHDLHLLFRLFRGEDAPDRVSRTQSDVLKSELQQLLGTWTPRDPTPNVVAIGGLLGKTAAMGAAKRLGTQLADAWVEALCGDDAEANTFCEANPQMDVHVYTETTTALQRRLTALIGDARPRLLLLRGLARHESAANPLFRCLPPEFPEKFFTTLARRDPEGLVGLAVEFLLPDIERLRPPSGRLRQAAAVAKRWVGLDVKQPEPQSWGVVRRAVLWVVVVKNSAGTRGEFRSKIALDIGLATADRLVDDLKNRLSALQVSLGGSNL